MTRVASVELNSCTTSPKSHFVFKKNSGTSFTFHMEAGLDYLNLTDSACEWAISESLKDKFIAEGYKLSNENINSINLASSSYCRSFHDQVAQIVRTFMGI